MEWKIPSGFLISYPIDEQKEYFPLVYRHVGICCSQAEQLVKKSENLFKLSKSNQSFPFSTHKNTYISTNSQHHFLCLKNCKLHIPNYLKHNNVNPSS